MCFVAVKIYKLRNAAHRHLGAMFRMLSPETLTRRRHQCIPLIADEKMDVTVVEGTLASSVH